MVVKPSPLFLIQARIASTELFVHYRVVNDITIRVLEIGYDVHYSKMKKLPVVFKYPPTSLK